MERTRKMAEAGEEPRRARHPGKRGGPGKKARKARRIRRRKNLNGRGRALLIKAIVHPLRRRILRVMTGEGEPLSPVQISKKLGVSLSMVVYHATVLRICGAVEPAGERQVRGAIEHFFEVAIEDDPPIEALLEETREADEEDG